MAERKGRDMWFMTAIIAGLTLWSIVTWWTARQLVLYWLATDGRWMVLDEVRRLEERGGNQNHR